MPAETGADGAQLGGALGSGAPSPGGPGGTLCFIVEWLPPEEQVFTIGQLSKAWRRWAAARRAVMEDQWGGCAAAAPLWLVQEAWEGLAPWQRVNAVARAAGSGRMEVLEWACRQGFRLDERTCQAAARGGQLAALQWARRRGCRWDEGTCQAAAGGGHVALLKWARESGAPWNERTCEAAARGGHLAALQWAVQNGCRWDRTTCEAAAQNGHKELLQWALEWASP
jgi:hypothetical protein